MRWFQRRLYAKSMRRERDRREVEERKGGRKREKDKKEEGGEDNDRLKREKRMVYMKFLQTLQEMRSGNQGRAFIRSDQGTDPRSGSRDRQNPSLRRDGVTLSCGEGRI